MVFTDLSGHVGLRAFQLDADCLRSGRAEQGPPPPMHGMGRGVMAWGFPWWDSTPVECFAGDQVLQLP